MSDSNAARTLRAAEVFTPTKIPQYTYIDRHLEKKRKSLHDALEEGSKAVSLSGPSKSGKTVFIEKELGKDCLIPVNGAGIDDCNVLWDRVFSIIGTPIQVKQSTKKANTGNIKQGAEVNLGVMKLSAGYDDSDTVESVMESKYAVDPLALIIKELGNSGMVLFIDDFHYIAKDAQARISEQIKDAISKGVHIILASVPYHSDDAVRKNPDLRGRLVTLDFDYWGEDELKEIAVLGFNALNIEIDESTLMAFASEAAGSPQLMQAICLNACREAGYNSKQETKVMLPNAHTVTENGQRFIENVCSRTVEGANHSSIVEKMKDGPKTRGNERKTYKILGEEGEFDVYPLIVKAFASDPPALQFRYRNLLERLDKLCGMDSGPGGSSVSGACKFIADIANGADGVNLLEWDSENEVMNILDPYLLFFIRWGD